MSRTLIVAEAGINHGGDIHVARDFIDAAKAAGADIVKFQMFRDRPEIEHLRLSENDFYALYAVCNAVGIEMMVTPFYLEAVAFLDPLVKRHKIASGWMRSRAIFDAAVATGKPVIASTGMESADCEWPEIPNVSLLHCVSLYPCPDDKANLQRVRRSAGYSDHTVGTLACVAAVALGAKIIEKHITFDKTAEGPDHACSAEPEEFAEMVRLIRRVERMLGDGVKRVMDSEAECAKVWRK